MDLISGKFWACGIILFVIKSLADFYMGYFKWLQALSARRQAQLAHELELAIVTRISEPRVLLWIAGGCLTLGIISQLLQKDLRFPFLTFMSLLISTGISIIASLGDHSRSELA